MRHNKQGGFTLLELLIVVAIIAIIAAMLIPNLLMSLQKAKQKRTVAEVRNIGTAWISWLGDQIGGASAGVSKHYPGGVLTDLSYVELFGYLHPTDTFFYMQEVPQLDGWLYPLAFGKNTSLIDTNVIIICSGGNDGLLLEGDCTKSYDVAPFVGTDFEQDIVWADGYFLRWPG